MLLKGWGMISNKSGPILTIDIGGTKLAGGIVTPDGLVRLHRQIPTTAQEGGEAVMDRVIALARTLWREAQGSDLTPAAIGIGTGGQVHPQKGEISFATAAIPGWTGMPIRRRVAETLNLPTFVDNDANVMALGETIFGGGRGHNYVIGLTVGTGIGGGIIIDGRLYHGAQGFAADLGHIIIDYQGRRLCPCGRRGCLEAYASAPVVVADFVKAMGKRRLKAELGLEPEEVGVKHIAELLQTRIAHSEAWYAIYQGATFLGIGIATLLNIFNPEVVVVGGGVAQTGARYFEVIRQTVQERATPIVAETPILPAQLGPQANLVGAACLAWQGLNGGHDRLNFPEAQK